LKLDTQGTELEILQSLDQSQLVDLLAVEVEVEFLELYSGQPLFPDVHDFMTGSGFQLVDLRTHRAYRADDFEEAAYLRRCLKTSIGTPVVSAELVAGDALYLRTADPNTVFESIDQMARCLMLNQMYHYYDLNLWLLHHPLAHEVLTPDDQAEIVGGIVRSVPRPRYAYRTGRGYDLLRRVRARFLGPVNEYNAFWTRRAWPDQ